MVLQFLENIYFLVKVIDTSIDDPSISPSLYLCRSTNCRIVSASVRFWVFELSSRPLTSRRDNVH